MVRLPGSVIAVIQMVARQEVIQFRNTCICKGFPGGLDGKASACNAGDKGVIPGSGRCPREGNGNPLQNSCLENPMDGGAC